MASKKRKLSDPDNYDLTDEDEVAVVKLKEIFPNAPLRYLKSKVANHREENIQSLVTQMLLNTSVDEQEEHTEYEEDEEDGENTADESCILVDEELTENQQDCYNQLKDVLMATALSLPNLGMSDINDMISNQSLQQIVKQLPTTMLEVNKVNFLPSVLAFPPSFLNQLREVILTVTKEFNSPIHQEENLSVLDYSVTREFNTQMVHDDTTTVFDDTEVESASGSNTVTTGWTEDSNITVLSSVFPTVDPEFIQRKALEIGNDQEKLETFISTWLDRKSSLPSRKEYDVKMAREQEERKIRKMTPMDYINLYEDPGQHFLNTTSKVSSLYKENALYYLHKHFPTHNVKDAEELLQKNNQHFFATFKALEKIPPPKKGKKIVRSNPKKPQLMDIQFLKEYIYFKLESKITRKLQKTKDMKLKEIEEARRSGGLFECQCCFDSDNLLREVVMCDNSCMICPDCVRRGSGVQIGDGKCSISCLGGCGENLPLVTLRTVLSTIMYDQLVRRKQLEEVAAAGLEDLVQCPACNFATIMPDPMDKVLICGNQECGRETCRLCQEESHVPLTCQEVEKDGEVKLRTRLEDAMTEAMVRECVKCKKRFFKDEGCNRMHCECGQFMCYLCRKPVPDDYTHFYGEGAIPVPGKCPLWSENKNLHKHEVNKAVEEEKKKMDLKNLKNDPTKNLEKPRAGYDPNKIATPLAVDLSDNDEYDEDTDVEDGSDLSDFIASSDDEYDAAHDDHHHDYLNLLQFM